MFATAIYFQVNLIFVSKAGSQPLEWIPIWSYTVVGSSLASNYLTRVEVNGSGKHSSLLGYSNNYSPKKFYSTGGGVGLVILRMMEKHRQGVELS